jgi:hypothetical protein
VESIHGEDGRREEDEVWDRKRSNPSCTL